MADEVAPGIGEDLLAGEIKATEKDIRELVSAEPEARPAIVERMRHPPPNDQKRHRTPKSGPSETAVIKQIAEDMLETTNNGTESTMIREMKEALESMKFRWSFCQTNYEPFFEQRDCRAEIRKLIQNGSEFFTQFEGGLSQYDETESHL